MYIYVMRLIQRYGAAAVLPAPRFIAPRRLRLVCAGLIIAAIFVSAPISIATSAAISQGYKSSEPVPAGALVSLDQANPLTVQPANRDRLESMLGVVVAPTDSLISFATEANQVQVATNGLASAMVSNIDGDIKKGDKITASPINGIGMKANTSTKVVGVAQADFDPNAPGTTKKKIKDNAGKEYDISIGQLPILVDVAYYVKGTGDDKTPLPKFLQDLSTLIAGKKVSTARIIAGLVILLVGLASATILLYSSARSSIISIGRNPLSQKAVYKGLIQVFIVVLVILAVSFGVVYVIMTR